jgi:RNA polymerase sigma factor (sigma-70 family)
MHWPRAAGLIPVVWPHGGDQVRRSLLRATELRTAIFSCSTCENADNRSKVLAWAGVFIMESASASKTSATLLGRLRQDPSDQAAWAEFVERYGRMIYVWCRQRDLQDADAEDVTQNLLLHLAKKMRSFAYDPSRSFRSWLKTLTQHALSDFVASRKPLAQGSGDDLVHKLLHNVAACEDLETRFDQAFDQELLEAAMSRVRLRVQPQTWGAFWLTAHEGLSGAAAAGKLNMQVSAVYRAKSKVQSMLREEVRKLEQPTP